MREVPQRSIRKQGRHAFSLVEVVLVIGVLAFAVIPLVGSLTVAYTTSRAAQRNMEAALVLQSSKTIVDQMNFDVLRTNLTSGGLRFYFEQGGRYLGTNAAASNIFYRCTVVTNATGVSTNLARLRLQVAYPASNYPNQIELPSTVFRYGSRM